MSTLKVTNAAGLTGTSTNMMDGLVKAYCNVDQTGTQSIRDSSNISSITDDGVGQTDTNYTNNMSSADYGFTGTKGRTSGQNGNCIAHTNSQIPTTTYIAILCFQENNSTIDDERANIAIYGDLA